LFGPEGRRFTQGSSGAIIYDLVDELEAREVDPELTDVAFLVPSSIACEAIHEWRLAESVANDPPIGASYTVTVRPLERLDRTPLVRRRFKKAWDELKKRAAQMLALLDPNAVPPSGGVPALILDASAALKRDLSASLEKQGVRCLVLREAPCATALGQLNAVLETTAPAILWYRDPTASADHIEKTMREILEAGSIADLPRRIREERLEAFRDETGTHRGAQLTLIWDDTDYLPPEHDRDARAKVETI
jgi:vWA-MoxR associated protein C-terminal domain